MAVEQARATLDRLSKVIRSRSSEVQRLEEYYRGKQRLKFATDSWAKYHRDRFKDFADNWCQVVVDSVAERMLITGLSLPGGPESGADPGAEALWKVWQESDGDAISSQGFVESLIARRSFTLVWGDPPRITWEHPSQVAVEYDPETRRRTGALKLWRDGDMDFATVYLPDGLYKFEQDRTATESRTESGLFVAAQQQPSGWGPREIPDEVWPLPNPFGEVPVVEWPNRPMLAGEPMSEIDGVAKMQDAINLMWAYLFTSADHASWPQRVLMGAEPPKIPVLDSDGNVVGEKTVDMEKLAQDRFLFLTGSGPERPQIGQFEPAKLDVFGLVIEQLVQHVAAQTRTPPHYLAGKLPNANAETLKTAETGLVKKVEEFQTFASPAGRETFRLSALAMGDTELADRVRLGTVQWKNPEMRSEAQLADAMLKRIQMGFPFRAVLEDMGYSDFQIERIMGMRKDEQTQMLAADVAEVFG